MEQQLHTKAQIEAKVFRAKKIKPWYIPEAMWRMAKRKRLWFAGTWQNMGVIASTEQGTLS